MDRQCRPSMNACVYVCFHVHLCLRGLCFHMCVSGAFTVNPKKWVQCVYLCPRALVAGEKRAVRSSFKSSRRVSRIKYLGRRSLDLHVLAETPGSHWFLTRQLGHHYNKMHYSQPHVPSDTLASLTPLLSAFIGHCARVCVSTEMDTTQGLPSTFSPRQDSTSQDRWPAKLLARFSNLAFSQTHAHHYMCEPHSYTRLEADQRQAAAIHQYSSTWDRDKDRLRASYWKRSGLYCV